MKEYKTLIITIIVTLIVMTLMPYGCALNFYYLDKFNDYLEREQP